MGTVSNCKFVGVEFNEDATDCIQTIAVALRENAKALGQLAETLNSNHINIECMIRVEPDNDAKP